MKLYVLKDCVSGQCSVPFGAQNNQEAMRHFDLFCKKSDFSGADFQLYFICDFDVQSGLLSNIAFEFVKNGEEV